MVVNIAHLSSCCFVFYLFLFWFLDSCATQLSLVCLFHFLSLNLLFCGCYQFSVLCLLMLPRILFDRTFNEIAYFLVVSMTSCYCVPRVVFVFVVLFLDVYVILFISWFVGIVCYCCFLVFFIWGTEFVFPLDMVECYFITLLTLLFYHVKDFCYLTCTGFSFLR